MPLSTKDWKLEEDYRQPYTEWLQQPDKARTGRLLKVMDPLVRRAVASYAGQEDPALIGEAKLLAVDALKRYDPRQARLSTHVFRQLESLKRVARKQQAVLKVPEKLQLDQQMMQRMEEELRESFGRDPTDDELSDYSGLNYKRLQKLRKFKSPLVESTLTAAVGPEEGGQLPAVQSTNQTSWLSIVHGDLDSTNKKIFEWTLGWNGQPVLSNQQIAVKLRLSPGAISKRKQLIQAKIDEGDRLSPFR